MIINLGAVVKDGAFFIKNGGTATKIIHIYSRCPAGRQTPRAVKEISFEYRKDFP